METENEIFTAIINNNEELALKLIDENTNDITKLNIREENLLSTAVFYNMDKLVSKLLSLDSFKSVINKGINPFYTWNSRLENYFQDLSNSYEHSFLERKFDTEKSFKILELLLDNTNDLELPDDFLFQLPIEPIKNNLTTATRNYDIFIEKVILEILKSKKVDKIINNKKYNDITFLEKLVRSRDMEEAVNLILTNKSFTELNNNNNTWYKDYSLYGLNVSNSNALTACLSMNRNGKINDILKTNNLLRIVTDENIDESLVVDLLAYLLRYRDHLISPNSKNEIIFNQIERITPLIIGDVKKSEIYNSAYEELILIACMYGKTESLKKLIDSNIPFSTNTYNLIIDYAIKFPNKDEKTVKKLEDILQFRSIEKILKRNTSNNNSIEDELAKHIFMYYTSKHMLSPIFIKHSNLENVALENILNYFDNALDIINELEKIEYNYRSKEFFPIIDRNIKRENLPLLDQTREVYEYSMYRCFNPNSDENNKKLVSAKIIAKHLINNFELSKEEVKPKIKQKKIPYKLKEILINYK